MHIRCGNCHHTHATTGEVYECHFPQDIDYLAELAAERALEDAGYEAARAQEDHERALGVIGFMDAWAIASPETCPALT